jgi:hypothetical protein
MTTSYLIDPAPKLAPVLEGKKVVFSREAAEKPAEAKAEEQPKQESKQESKAKGSDK